jgi:hypothetical protein
MFATFSAIELEREKPIGCPKLGCKIILKLSLMK